MTDRTDQSQREAAPGDPARESSRGGGEAAPKRTIVGAIKKVGLFVGITALAFVWIEGCSSATIALYEAARGPDEPIYSEYDAEIGWVNSPSIDIPDLWGPGNGLQINAQRFRAQSDITAEQPAGRLRVLCSGDSFAFGEGVANLETWCHLLTLEDERLETVNLGQPGYGVDQSYLRYARDAESLEHTIHLFTFIGPDIARMGRPAQVGYAKPVLRLDGEELIVSNVPVPRLMPAVARFSERLSERLGSVDFGRRILWRLVTPRPIDTVEEHERVAPVARAVLQRVRRLTQERGSVPVFVYLPIDTDLDHDHRWRLWVNEAMDDLGYTFIDMTRALRSVPRETAETYFIPQSAPAGGHYSVAGNRWVAAVLYDQLLELPATAAMLAKVTTPADSPDSPENRAAPAPGG